MMLGADYKSCLRLIRCWRLLELISECSCSLQGCEGKPYLDASGPISLVPIALYGKNVTDAIEYAYTAFESLRDFTEGRPMRQ